MSALWTNLTVHNATPMRVDTQNGAGCCCFLHGPVDNAAPDPRYDAERARETALITTLC